VETRILDNLHPGNIGAITVYCSCGTPDCTVSVALPSGGQAAVTGPKPAAPANQWMWTFKIPATEGPGTAVLTLKCGSHTNTFNITIS
jgi:hypothetical protein